MYAAYLYILRAFDSAAGARLGGSPDPEREIADGRWPSAAVSRCDSPSSARGIENIPEVARARTGQVLTTEAPAPGVGWP